MVTTEETNIDTTTEMYYYYYYHYDDLEKGKQLYRWTLVLSIIPVCFVGLAANTVSVWVWNASKKHKPMVLLFQCLGVTDSIFLLLTAVRGILYYLKQLTKGEASYFAPLRFLSLSFSVHVTVAIGVFRWLGVAFPQRMQRMSPCHVRMICAGLGGWCGLLTALLVVEKETIDLSQAESLAMIVTLQVVTFILPNVVLLGFGLRLLKIVCQRQWRRSTGGRGRMSVAVLSIVGCSLVSCIVGESGKFLGMLGHRSDDDCDWVCAFTGYAVGQLSQVLNSSVNFLFYFFFASQFRPLLRQTFCRCRGERSQTSSRKSSTSSGLQITSDSSSLRLPQNTAGPTALEMTDKVTEEPAEAPTEPAEV